MENQSTRYRITYEARQVVLDYCKPGATEPKGVVWTGLVLTGGVRCRLSNISSDGRWLKDELFRVRGKDVQRKKGEKVGNIMQGWRDIRSNHPELLKGLSVTQQPAATMDNIIRSWVIEEEADWYPISYWQRDVLACSHSQIQTPIAGKTTTYLQLTDTDFFKQFKYYMRQEMDELRHKGQQQLLEQGVRETWRAELPHVAETIQYAHQQMVRESEEKQWVLAGLVRNGTLAYKPEWNEEGERRLVITEGMSWREGMSMGASRMRSLDWLKDRYAWVDEEGIPLEPVWSMMTESGEVADLVEWDYWHGGQGELGDEEEALLAIGELPPEMQLACLEQGVLSMSLDLQRAAWHRHKGVSEELKKEGQGAQGCKESKSSSKKSAGSQEKGGG